ncbi:MAG TPA: OmpA family protein, partial [candidate division Zixibacteria bacterium]|nr:OmpA family protein [candidate division Zixibacteria bacterium]
EKMEQNPGSVATIAGHTDQTGSARYNMQLGQMRAEATKLFLADRCGAQPYRMFIISYGKSKPAAMGDERNAASKNRRVQVTIWGIPQQQ